MKSQPDAASRRVAEVVTQLPVPSRLGMLRFERLNEANWALLFLDPNCERQFGLPASELCALVGSPYASLMEPEARYRLHDSIQQQLAQQAHYRIHYVLHTAQGLQHLLEIGEPYKQRNRHLLRGYLLVVDAPVSEAPTPATNDLETQNSRLQIALQLNQCAQQEQLRHLDRVRAQQALVLRLARQRYLTNDPLLEASELITRSACEIYAVECASLWNLEGQQLQPITAFYRADDSYRQMAAIDIGQYPNYLEALHTSRAINVNDASGDPRTRDMAASLREARCGCDPRCQYPGRWPGGGRALPGASWRPAGLASR